MDRNEVFELIRDRLADILEIEAGTISEGQSFADDLEADSLAMIELVEAIEEEVWPHFQIAVADGKVVRITQVFTP